MDPTILVPQIVAAFQQHNWLALVLVLAMVARKWLGPDSKFPAELSPNLRPVVFAGAGLVVTVIATRNAGQMWGASLLAGLSMAAMTGFADGLLAAIFGSKERAPKWALWIVMVFDEVEGGSGSAQGSGTGSVAPTPADGSTKVAMKRGSIKGKRWLKPGVVRTAAVAFLAMVTPGCLSNTPIVPVTPANQAAVSQCQTDSNVHNGAIIGSLISGAVGTAAGAVAVADSDPTGKKAFGITGAAAAGLTTVGAGIIALTSQLYTTGGCPQITGPLPTLGKDGKPIAQGFIPGDFAR